VTSSATSHNRPAPEPKKLKDCNGNACPRCGKCRDYYYDGNIRLDYQRWTRDYSCREIIDKSRWHSRPNATCVLLALTLFQPSFHPEHAYGLGCGHCCRCG
jgi:hypothetical protein